MENSLISSRLKEIIEYLGLSDSQFADQCGISRATLSLLLSGKNKKISDIFLNQIHRAFPGISILWLLFGEGNINIPSSNENEILTPSNNMEENANEDGELMNEGIKFSENLNLNSVNALKNIIKESVNKEIISLLETKIIPFAEELKNNDNRRVVQITVYYDDSTFETFLPSK